MQSIVRRFIALGVSLMTFGLGLAATAVPAQAATSSYYVDNTMPLCKPGAFPSIQAAVTAAGGAPAKITVCPGTYAGGVVINGANKLKLIAKKGVTLVPNVNPFNANLIYVQHSSSVTVQGFTIDGQGHVGSFIGLAGISYYESSGVITKNNIVNWYTSGYPATRKTYAIGTAGSAWQTIRINKNTITNPDTAAIFSNGQQLVTIAANKITAAVAAGGTSYGIYLVNGATGKISGNKVYADAFPPASGTFTGVYVVGSSNVQVRSNTISRASVGIQVRAHGATISGDVVRGNKLLDTYWGMYLIALAMPSGSAYLQNLQVTGNRLTNTLATGQFAIIVTASGSGANTGHVQNALVRRNTMKNFTYGVNAVPDTGQEVSGIFEPNKLIP